MQFFFDAKITSFNVCCKEISQVIEKFHMSISFSKILTSLLNSVGGVGQKNGAGGVDS